jgi:hypothetical protein
MCAVESTFLVHVAVKEPDGTVTEWLLEGGSPNQLIRMRVTDEECGLLSVAT